MVVSFSGKWRAAPLLFWMCCAAAFQASLGALAPAASTCAAVLQLRAFPTQPLPLPVPARLSLRGGRQHFSRRKHAQEGVSLAAAEGAGEEDRATIADQEWEEERLASLQSAVGRAPHVRPAAPAPCLRVPRVRARAPRD
jgi:hypothetical protein